MLMAESAKRQDLERQVELCVKIADLGFGPEVMRLALERRNVPPPAAQLIALSVAGSRAALTRIEAAPPAAQGRAPLRQDLRQARAAGRLIGNVAAFFWFGLVAVGGGLALGWIVGFEYGTASGLDSVERALETLFQR